MRLTLIQMEVVDGEPEQNIAHACELIRSAPGAALYLLPELWTIGYARDSWSRYLRDHHEKTLQQIHQLSDELNATIGGSFIAPTENGAIANRFIVIAPGRKQALYQYDKVHLFGPLGEHESLQSGQRRVHGPLGEWHVGLSICYDLRFPESYRRNALEGTNLFLIPAQWPQERCHQMVTLAQARAIEDQAYVALCNRIGSSPAGIDFGGHSGIWAPDGAQLADGMTHESIISADLDLRKVETIRTTMPVLQSRVPAVDTLPE